MGWLNKEVRDTFTSGWEHYFHGKKNFNARKISRETGLPMDMVEALNAATTAIGYTRKWKLKVVDSASSIPVGPNKHASKEQEMEIIYHCLLGILRGSRIKYPMLNDWMDLLRVCVRGREKKKKFYIITQELLSDKLKEIGDRRFLLEDEIENRVKRTTSPRRSPASHRIHLEFAVANVLYRALGYVCYPKERSIRGILRDTLVGAIKAYRKDVKYDDVGPLVYKLMNSYISKFKSI